jgi:hypothetical protein
MKRAAQCNASVFLIAEEESKPCGLVRECMTERAPGFISVHLDRQRCGVGTLLVDAIKDESLAVALLAHWSALRREARHSGKKSALCD